MSEGWALLFPPVSPRTLARQGHRMPAYLAEELWMQDLESGEGYYCKECGGAFYTREGHVHGNNRND